MPLGLFEIKQMMMQMSELGVANYVKHLQPAKDKLSQRQAYKRFGESDVRRWCKDGLISRQRTGKKENSKFQYSYAELLACQKADKLLSYSN